MQVVQRWAPLVKLAMPAQQAKQEAPPPELPRLVLQQPFIVSHPADLQINEGDAAEFFVHAEVGGSELEALVYEAIRVPGSVMGLLLECLPHRISEALQLTRICCEAAKPADRHSRHGWSMS